MSIFSHEKLDKLGFQQKRPTIEPEGMSTVIVTYLKTLSGLGRTLKIVIK